MGISGMLYSTKLFIAASIFIITSLNYSLAADSIEPETTMSLYESLYDAIKMDSEEEVKQFIAFGADVDHRYEGEKTPLMLASSLGSIGAVRTLLMLGANRYLKSEEGMTAMDYADENNDVFITAVLKVKDEKILPEEIIAIEPEEAEIIEIPAKANTNKIEEAMNTPETETSQ